MRILQLINTLEHGGAEQILSTLSIELSRRSHEVHVACLRDPGVMPVPKSCLDEAGVQFVAFYKRDGFRPETLRQLSRYIRTHAIDVVHSHNPLASHYGAIAARMGGAAAAINTLHGTATLTMPRWALALFWASAMASDRLVSVCRSVEATLRRRLVLPASKCTVIYNGIPTADLAAIPARREDGTIVFGTMARLVPVKDHNSLLKAFASLWHRYPSARLEILGDGELRADLERQAEGLGLRNATRFLGWSADITAFLSRIDVFVLSSLSEGLPLTVLEAMASGKPVVATAVGGVPELVEDANCGWISLPGDSDGLANAMANAISAPDRRERGENGRMRALQRHSLESMCDDYEHLFADVLHRKGRRVATRKDAAVLAIR